jgi:hypothetical protein
MKPPASSARTRIAPRACSGLLLLLACTAATAAPATPPRPGGGEGLVSIDLIDTVRWVIEARDNRGAPFIVVDKRKARLQVHAPDGRLLGSSPVLLGLSRGDRVASGFDERPLSQIGRDERVTPAGRYLARPGRNHRGEDIIWVDYDAGISMHRVRAISPAEHRMERLASSSASDNRISYGCINVPIAFYDAVLSPVAQRAAVIYVLPETGPAASWFGFEPRAR